MRLIVPHMPDRVHNETKRSVLAHGPRDVTFVRLSDTDTAYYDLLENTWAGFGTDLWIVEQDIEIHEGCLRQFDECLRPWCVFSYQVEKGLASEMGCGGFGCVRWRQEIMNPDWFRESYDIPFGDWPPGHWGVVDSRLAIVLRRHGIDGPCVHYPQVTHHRVYHHDENWQTYEGRERR